MTAPAILAMESESPLLVAAQANACGPDRCAGLFGLSLVARSAASSPSATALADSQPSPMPTQGSIPETIWLDLQQLITGLRSSNKNVHNSIV